MKIIVIEDEIFTAEDLIDTLKRVDPETEIVKTISSVKEGLEYFSGKPNADLIFSDIQLGDGLSFEIFKSKKVNIPVIFCTAFDEYALNAFETNSIDYILKPFSEVSIHSALEKFNQFKYALQDQDIKGLSKTYGRKAMVSSLLVHHRGEIIPIPLKEIAVIFKRHGDTFVKTFKGKAYFHGKMIGEIEENIGSDFFRANRQNLVNKTAVKSLEVLHGRKHNLILTIPHDKVITVSKEKYTPLIKWLESGE